MSNIKKIFTTFTHPAGNAILTIAMISLWFLGIWMDAAGWSQLCTSLAIAVLLYLLVEGAGRLEQDSKRNQRHMREILLMAATVPAVKREYVLQQQDLQLYTGEVLDRYLHSISQCQFYEKLNITCSITHESAARSSTTKKFVKTEADVEITLRRFGTAPFLFEVGIDDDIQVEIKHIIMGNERFAENTDYEIVACSGNEGNSLKVRFKNNRWEKYDQATISYKMAYHEFDHWTYFAWVA